MCPCLGITGGIGSGKSYISQIFSALGIAVYDADTETKLLYGRDAALRDGLVALLGEEIFQGGVLQKEVMAGKIFSCPELLAKVNVLVHPAVFRDFTSWRSTKSPYVIMESAILAQTPFASVADRMLTVSAPLALRMERLQRRDQAEQEDLQRRINNQWSDAMREAKADFVIYSDGKNPLLPQVEKVHRIMLFLAQENN
jgi:dephospho-CoA kinase